MALRHGENVPVPHVGVPQNNLGEWTSKINATANRR